MPALVNLTSNELPGSSNPESNRPSGAPGVPDVTVCISPAKLQRTVSPTAIAVVAGENWKFIAATVTVAAWADPVVNTTSSATATGPAALRASLRLAILSAIAY